MPLAFQAARNSRTSLSVYGRATHWSWFLRKICTTEQPTARPRSRARESPPAMDMWAPSRSRVELAGDLMKLALEPTQAAAQRGAAAAGVKHSPLDEREERGGDLLGFPPATGVVPLVHPVHHAEHREHDEPRVDVAERAAPDAVLDDPLHPLVVAVLLGGERAREARGQVGLLPEEHGQEGAIGDHELHVLAHDAPQLVLRAQARAQHEAQIPDEGVDGLPRDRGEHLLLGPEVGVEGG